MFKSWCRLSTTKFFSKAACCHVPLHGGTIQVFGQDVRHIVVAKNFNKLEIFATKLFLDPKVCRSEVANFAQPSSTADTNSSNSISLHHQLPFEAKVSGNGQ